MQTIGFLGSGNMAQALIKGIITANLYKPENILISDIRSELLKSLEDQFSVKAANSNAELAQKTGIIVLAVKPQNMKDVLEDIKTTPGQLIISIAAGVKTATIANILGNIPIVRVMPNTPALIAAGAAALYANDTAKPMLDTALSIFSSVGKAVIVEDEDLIDAVTAVSGSGPAYYFLLMEEMIKAAVELGLTPDIAKTLVLQTAKGAALLACDADTKNETPAQLREKVTSPGGTTEAALKTLEQADFSQIISTAIKSACDRSKQLSNQ